MKRTPFIAILWCLTVTQTVTSQQFLSTKLGFMYSMPIAKVSELAKRLNMPVLVYMNSQNCSDSKRFSREVLNMPTVIKLLRTKYVCMNANVDSSYGSAMARKYQKLIMPVVVLISPDGNLEYCCNLNLDTLNLITQLNAFYTACSLRDAINLMVRTSSMKFNAASDKIASYYTDRYMKEYKTIPVDVFLRSQTLGLEYFKRYSKTFVAELGRKQALSAQ